MAQKENAYPWPYGRQMVRAFPLPPAPPPAWRVPVRGFEVVPRAILPVFPALLQRMGPKSLLAETGLGIWNYILSGAANLNLITL